MKAYPTFKVGDLVEWNPNTRNTPECRAYWRKTYGRGPFRVHSISKAPEAHKRPDKQILTIEINGQAICSEAGTPAVWTCAWFRKVQ